MVLGVVAVWVRLRDFIIIFVWQKCYPGTNKKVDPETQYNA